jgi:hypothetical protein
VEYQFDIVAEGTSIKVNQDNVLKTTQTVAEHVTVTGGVVSDDLATNDIELSTHPYPALGAATDRALAPQTNDTGTMSENCLVYIRKIKVPAVDTLEYEFGTA